MFRDKNIYGTVEIGHVNGETTKLYGARIEKSETVGYHPEEGAVKEYTVKYSNGHETQYYGCWFDEK